MAERIDDRLLYQILKGLQARVTVLEAMLGEIRDGFTSIRGLRSTLQGEASALERRIDELERSLERVHRRLLADERDHL